MYGPGNHIQIKKWGTFMVVEKKPDLRKMAYSWWHNIRIWSVLRMSTKIYYRNDWNLLNPLSSSRFEEKKGEFSFSKNDQRQQIWACAEHNNKKWFLHNLYFKYHVLCLRFKKHVRFFLASFSLCFRFTSFLQRVAVLYMGKNLEQFVIISIL